MEATAVKEPTKAPKAENEMPAGAAAPVEAVISSASEPAESTTTTQKKAEAKSDTKGTSDTPSPAPARTNTKQDKHAAIDITIDASKKPQDKTFGEKAFDFFTYKMINFGFNYGLSMAIMDVYLGDDKQKASNKPTSYFAEKINKGWFSKIANGARDSHAWMKDKAGETVADLFSLNMGGHFAAVVVYHLEKQKSNLVRWFDKVKDSLTGTKLTEEDKEFRKQRYDAVDAEEKKTAGKIAFGRVAGMIFNMVFYRALELGDKGLGKLGVESLREPTGHPDEKQGGKRAVRRLTQWLGDGFQKDARERADRNGKTYSDMSEKRLKYWPEIMAYDLVCTWTTSAVLEKVVKFDFNKKKKEEIPAATATAATDDTAKPGKADSSALAFTGQPNRGFITPSRSRQFYTQVADNQSDKEWQKRQGSDQLDNVGVTL